MGIPIVAPCPFIQTQFFVYLYRFYAVTHSLFSLNVCYYELTSENRNLHQYFCTNCVQKMTNNNLLLDVTLLGNLQHTVEAGTGIEPVYTDLQ